MSVRFPADQQESPGPEPTPPSDPWMHRSIGMRCKTCMWFVPKASATGSVGRCRRHSPVVGQGWPAVFVEDWCGDHKLDETKA